MLWTKRCSMRPFTTNLLLCFFMVWGFVKHIFSWYFSRHIFLLHFKFQKFQVHAHAVCIFFLFFFFFCDAVHAPYSLQKGQRCFKTTPHPSRFVRIVIVWICRFSLPLGVWEGLRFVIVALPVLFSSLFFISFTFQLLFQLFSS